MVFDWYQHLPLHIDPIAFTIGFFSFRWYAISYVAGFFAVYLVLLWRVKKGEIKNVISHRSSVIKNVQEKDGGYLGRISNEKLKIQNQTRNKKYEIRNTIFDFLLVVFFSSLVGGRIGYVLIYNFPYFFAHPVAIISPFENGNFAGIYGMSYHGALVGILIGSFIFLRRKKIDPALFGFDSISSAQKAKFKKSGINFWQWADFVVPAVPPGYFFGRIGNFLNGELYGRITNSPLGMYFASDPFRLRHPSQLYEAFFEGLALFAILWSLRNKKIFSGGLLAIYFIGYGIFRIFVEQFRQPDSQIGLLGGYFTMGQLLSFLMIIFGMFILIFKIKKK